MPLPEKGCPAGTTGLCRGPRCGTQSSAGVGGPRASLQDPGSLSALATPLRPGGSGARAVTRPPSRYPHSLWLPPPSSRHSVAPAPLALFLIGPLRQAGPLAGKEAGGTTASLGRGWHVLHKHPGAPSPPAPHHSLAQLPAAEDQPRPY